MNIFTYTDRDGDSIVVCRDTDGKLCIICRCEVDGEEVEVHIAKEDVPAFIALVEALRAGAEKFEIENG